MVGDGSELTPAEVAREFKVSPSTVRRWGSKGWLVASRRLPGSTYRRYSREDVDAFRDRYEAGEYDEVPPVAANRPRDEAADDPPKGSSEHVNNQPEPPTRG